MLFWSIAIAIAAIVSVALFYSAAGRTVNAATASGEAATTTHHKLQLREIETDLASGRLAPAEAELARAELAREVLRQRGEARAAAPSLGRVPVVPLATVAVVGVAFIVYAGVGSPNLPSQPLAERSEQIAALNMNVDDAVKAIEDHLMADPADLRGWQVIAPVYMRAQRFADAERAFRAILDLSPATSDSETDLAEALILKANGDVDAEALTLLRSAAARDPRHLRSRFYLAGEASRVGDFERAKTLWSELIAMGQGDEPWLEIARNGLAMAEAGAQPPAPAAEAPLDPAVMVARLAERLAGEGGTLADWTQLVRSYLVLEQTAAAQRAYDGAVAAYPDTSARAELDALAKQGGLALGNTVQ